VRRLRLLTISFVLFVVVVLAQMVLLKITNSPSQPNQVSAQVIDTSRGRIVDRDGTLLATDSFVWEIYLDPSRYKPEKFTPDMVAVAAGELGVEPGVIMEAIGRSGAVSQIVKNATKQQCDAATKSQQVPSWFWCDAKRKRSYPQGPLAAHVVGFADANQVGQAGVEWFYDSWLRSAGDWNTSQLSGPGEPIPHEWELYLPSVSGRDLVLNLSAPLQHIAEQHLVDALAQYQATSGSILILDPRTGAVLALANWPTFDPNVYDKAAPVTWQNPAVSLLYEPGSIFKLITYGAGLDLGSIKPDQKFEDTGERKVGDKIIRNSQQRRLGWVTAWDALAESLNTVSADIGLKMGSEEFYRYVRLFGFGKPTEIDLGPEAAGIVKRWGTETWSPYDQAANSFGQGISVTPIQMVSAAAAIANKGVLLQPQVAKALVSNGQMHPLPVRKLGEALRPETTTTLTRMMIYTMENYANGKNLVPGFRVAGKTGTAEIPEEAGYTNPLTITSVVGFLPAADPQMVILVKLDKPKKSRWAEAVALPVFGEVARDAVQVMGLNPNTDVPR
ncbi:MAG: peptidoglycan D,D-transpeptidase FtsI family protein, partial [Nitrososphaerales archaeon]